MFVLIIEGWAWIVIPYTEETVLGRNQPVWFNKEEAEKAAEKRNHAYQSEVIPW